MKTALKLHLRQENLLLSAESASHSLAPNRST